MLFLEGTTELFFDVPIWEQLLRLACATILGAVFGFERELKNKPAGFITFMLVSMGSCCIALLQINVFSMAYHENILGNGVSSDITRVIAQVVSGIGFLGAGTIIYNKGSIKGITTAAMLWVVSGIGLLIGMGGIANYVIATATALIFVPTSLLMRRYGRKIAEKYKVHRVFVCFDEVHEKDLYLELATKGGVLKKTFFHNKIQKNGIHLKEVYLYFSVAKTRHYEDIIDGLSNFDWIQSIEEA